MGSTKPRDAKTARTQETIAPQTTTVPDDATTAVEAGSTEAAAATPAPLTKTATVIALLSRAEGATLAELVAATGWLPHTTRAALTGLRKQGHAIVRGKRGEMTCYTIAPTEPQP